ncbi:MAG: aminotransferase class I/II-fold pyridoxal phosphate-dependent enzyme [Lachnospiraceae bacterium]|nr:aminotransferase class I/II-fold pyridoxal phosphate-dependent enzyme [Lachnospiraceae bacterium]
MFHKHGGDIYEYNEIRDFSANINFRGMPESVERAAMAAVARSVHYPDPEYRSLRRALAARENALLCQETDMAGAGAAKEPGTEGASLPGYPGGEVGPQHIICGNGAAELMFALAAAYRPKQALLAAPSFFEYEQALASFGCGIRRFYMEKESGFVLAEDFLDEIDEKTDIMILGNPNNPTGRLVETELLEKLLEICRERGILLVLDESFFDFLSGEDGRRTFSGVRRIRENPRLFVIKSFTKMYAMPGLRFGYGICSDTELLEQMRRVVQPWNVSVPAQAAAEAAAGELDFARETAGQTAVNRETMKRQMERLGYRVFPSDTNFLLFQGPEDLEELCLRQGVLIRDCSNFPGLEKGFFRICIRGKEENNKLLKILEEAGGEEMQDTIKNR